MRLWKSWLIARKELALLLKRKSILVAMMILPLVLGVGLPSLVLYLNTRRGFGASHIEDLLGAFGFFFLIFSVYLSLNISSNSLVGEKIEKSIEPLLATPTSDEEILLGKYIGAFIPVILTMYLGTGVFMLLSDVLLSHAIGYYFYPNTSFDIIMFLGIPLACIYSISFSVFISGKVNSTQGAYTLGVASIVPFIILYVMAEVGLISLTNNTNVLIISGVLLAMAVATFIVSKVTFNRERILTSWR